MEQLARERLIIAALCVGMAEGAVLEAEYRSLAPMPPPASTKSTAAQAKS